MHFYATAKRVHGTHLVSKVLQFELKRTRYPFLKMKNHVAMRSTVFVFFPLGCCSIGRLFGWTRTRLEPFEITVVVLGTLPRSRSEEVLTRTGAGVEDGQLELVGRLRSDVANDGGGEGSLLWMDWEIDEEQLPRLISFDVQIPHPENIEIKVEWNLSFMI